MSNSNNNSGSFVSTMGTSKKEAQVAANNSKLAGLILEIDTAISNKGIEITQAKNELTYAEAAVITAEESAEGVIRQETYSVALEIGKQKDIALAEGEVTRVKAVIKALEVEKKNIEAIKAKRFPENLKFTIDNTVTASAGSED